MSVKPGRAEIIDLFIVEAIGEPVEMEEGHEVKWLTVEEFLAESPFRAFYATILPRIIEQAVIMQASQ